MCGSVLDFLVPILVIALPFLIYSAWQSGSTTQYYAAMLISALIAVLSLANLLGLHR